MEEQGDGLARNARGQFVNKGLTCVCGNAKAVQRRMCPSCEADPVQRGKVIYALERMRFERRVNEEAERQTRNLRAGEPFFPVLANRIIEEWMRG